MRERRVNVSENKLPIIIYLPARIKRIVPKILLVTWPLLLKWTFETQLVSRPVSLPVRSLPAVCVRA
jgi:hypothetical protein